MVGFDWFFCLGGSSVDRDLAKKMKSMYRCLKALLKNSNVRTPPDSSDEEGVHRDSQSSVSQLSQDTKTSQDTKASPKESSYITGIWS